MNAEDRSVQDALRLRPLHDLLNGDINRKKLLTAAAKEVFFREKELAEASRKLADLSGTQTGTVYGVNLEANRKLVMKRPRGRPRQGRAKAEAPADQDIPEEEEVCTFPCVCALCS